MTTQCVANQLEHELGLPAGTISIHDRLGFCDWWNSLNHVIVVLWVASRVRSELEPDLIERCTSLEAIADLINQRNI
jgi:hypothetical protein